MTDLFGGFAILYLLVCLIPPAIAAGAGSPFAKGLFVWMLFTAWHPAGWLAAALLIWLTRGAAH